MDIVEPLPPSTVRRAAAVARGPHACPSCESPTFTEPPVPWTNLRDYLVRCDSCERPISVRVDRERLLRHGVAASLIGQEPGMYDAVAELLDTPGRHAFRMRIVAAALLPAVTALIALAVGAGLLYALIAATVAVVPGSLWGPALAGHGLEWVRGTRQRFHTWQYRHSHRTQQHPVEVEPGRWDQWHREERSRERERRADPEAVLRELERVLDDRELRRVRMLAVHGDVPHDHLDDLLRFRRSWTSVA